MQRVAEEAHTSKETLYSWFGDKAGLFKQLVAREARAVNEELGAALAGHEEGGDAGALLVRFGSNVLALLLGPRSPAINRAAIAAATTSPELDRILASQGRETIRPPASTSANAGPGRPSTRSSACTVPAPRAAPASGSRARAAGRGGGSWGCACGQMEAEALRSITCSRTSAKSTSIVSPYRRRAGSRDSRHLDNGVMPFLTFSKPSMRSVRMPCATATLRISSAEVRSTVRSRISSPMSACD